MTIQPEASTGHSVLTRLKARSRRRWAVSGSSKGIRDDTVMQVLFHQTNTFVQLSSKARLMNPLLLFQPTVDSNQYAALIGTVCSTRHSNLLSLDQCWKYNYCLESLGWLLLLDLTSVIGEKQRGPKNMLSCKYDINVETQLLNLHSDSWSMTMLSCKMNSVMWLWLTKLTHSRCRACGRLPAQSLGA